MWLYVDAKKISRTSHIVQFFNFIFLSIEVVFSANAVISVTHLLVEKNDISCAMFTLISIN